MNSSRNRLACASCTRRKVKCSKTVPCSNCIRRGEQNSCIDPAAHETRTHGRRATVPHLPTALSPAVNIDAQDESELMMLRRRITDLETELQRRPTQSPSVHESYPEPTMHRILAADEEPIHQATANESQSPSGDTVAEDAASILEFLAWGRRKNPDLLPVTSPEAITQASTVGDVQIPQANSDLASSDEGNLDDLSQTSVLQLLLPEPQKTWELVLWHENCLLWYHCSYYGPSLRSQLKSFYDKCDGSIEHPGIDLQWVAFLFSVLAGSITCLPAEAAERFGFDEREREILSKRWFQAAITCLNKADFASNHSILSIQAIATLTLSAHMLGFSNLQSTYLAASVRIAQSLGIHRLTATVPGGEVEKEAGRRVWSQICCQDWFSLPFSDTYLINPAYSKSEPPLNCNDGHLTSLPDSIPTVAGYSRFLGKIARIMPQLQDGLMSCNTLFTKYEQVLKWDKQLRTIAITNRPRYLSSIPLEPDWPVWVHWARRSLAISSAHKIIMIHRSFLSKSFSNPAFAFTRKTCLSASKTIMKEYKCVFEEDGPVLWIHQAFAVAASIILILDLFHSGPGEPSNAEHLQLIKDMVRMLHKCRNSTIAARGVKLLTSLYDEVSGTVAPQGSKRTSSDDIDESNMRCQKKPRLFNVPAFVKAFCNDQRAQAIHTSQIEAPTAANSISLADSFFDAGPFDEESIENLFYLASQDLSI